MAELAFTNAMFSVQKGSSSAVSLSDHVRSVTIDYKGEILDTTAMGSTARARISGLQDWSLTVEFNQDYAASSVDATLFALVGTTSTVALKVRPVNTSIAATNPEYQGNGVLEGYTPIGGAVGELATTTATFQGSGALTRDVTP